MERNVDTRVINRYLESCHSPPDNKVLKVAQLAISVLFYMVMVHSTRLTEA